MSQNRPPGHCVLILAPRGRDAEVIDQVLSEEGFSCTTVANLEGLVANMQHGASTAVIAEEALLETGHNALRAWLATQEPWSDFPFILLIPKLVGALSAGSSERLEALGNVILLEKPLNAQTLIRATASALRARTRQYQARDVLHLRDETARNLQESQHALRMLNETLEQRIHARTTDLAQANDRLMHEIAERERIQQSLIQTQKMEAVGQLTGGLAHDFNNVLSVIQGNMDLILMLSAEERIKRMAGAVRKATQRGAKLTGQLLAFSRTQQLDLKPTNLNEVIDGVRELIASSVGSNIQLSFDLSEKLPPVIADSNQIELAILNLVINARDAMPEGGKLAIQTTVRDGAGSLPSTEKFAVIQVRDAGEGINPAIIGKVFDPFFTTKSVGKGTGLGLSQVYGIAQQSGGTVTITSQVGTGTSVQLWLCLAQETEVVPQREPTQAAPRARSGRRLKVLVVEDEPDVRQFMVESLEVLGYSVVEAAHGEAGYHQLLNEQPDLMITDFLMPGMTGAELVKKVALRFPTLPIIVATGYADTQALEQVLEGNPVLRKPFRISDLAHLVQRALSQGVRLSY